jgi:hypothetical protein
LGVVELEVEYLEMEDLNNNLEFELANDLVAAMDLPPLANDLENIECKE